ncbi:MAG: response regulator [bacterium]|jgi:CheY-like chemotaxis protein|nr:response regulator [bacterium]
MKLEAARSVLVVEDNDDFRRVLAQFLAIYGFEPVRAAADGEEAWGLLADWRPDLLITDLNMPRISGIELMRLVREKWKDLPIIVITGYEHELHHLSAFQVQATLIKPFKMPLLAAEIARILGQGRRTS